MRNNRSLIIHLETGTYNYTNFYKCIFFHYFYSYFFFLFFLFLFFFSSILKHAVQRPFSILIILIFVTLEGNETFLFFFPFEGITKIFLRNTRLFIGRERTDYRTIRGSRYNVPESKFERTFFQNLLHRANRISILSLFNFLLRVFNGLKYRFLESIIHTTYI